MFNVALLQPGEDDKAIGVPHSLWMLRGLLERERLLNGLMCVHVGELLFGA